MIVLLFEYEIICNQRDYFSFLLYNKIIIYVFLNILYMYLLKLHNSIIYI